MVKKLALILIVFLVGCTTNQIKMFDRVLGGYRVLGSFEVDINNTEKQTFVVDKPRKPSFWGSRLDGQIHWIVHLCFDNVDTLERLPDHLNALIKTSLTIGGESYVFETDSVFPKSSGCWWFDERDEIRRQGWGISGVYLLSSEAQFNSPMVVEIQIIDDKDSVLKNTAKKYSNPYLLISTGD